MLSQLLSQTSKRSQPSYHLMINRYIFKINLTKKSFKRTCQLTQIKYHFVKGRGKKRNELKVMFSVLSLIHFIWLFLLVFWTEYQDILYMCQIIPGLSPFQFVYCYVCKVGTLTTLLNSGKTRESGPHLVATWCVCCHHYSPTFKKFWYFWIYCHVVHQ